MSDDMKLSIDISADLSKLDSSLAQAQAKVQAAGQNMQRAVMFSPGNGGTGSISSPVSMPGAPHLVSFSAGGGINARGANGGGNFLGYAHPIGPAPAGPMMPGNAFGYSGSGAVSFGGRLNANIGNAFSNNIGYGSPIGPAIPRGGVAPYGTQIDEASAAMRGLQMNERETIANSIISRFAPYGGGLAGTLAATAVVMKGATTLFGIGAAAQGSLADLHAAAVTAGMPTGRPTALRNLANYYAAGGPAASSGPVGMFASYMGLPQAYMNYESKKDIANGGFGLDFAAQANSLDALQQKQLTNNMGFRGGGYEGKMKQIDFNFNQGMVDLQQKRNTGGFGNQTDFSNAISAQFIETARQKKELDFSQSQSNQDIESYTRQNVFAMAGMGGFAAIDEIQRSFRQPIAELKNQSGTQNDKRRRLLENQRDTAIGAAVAGGMRPAQAISNPMNEAVGQGSVVLGTMSGQDPNVLRNLVDAIKVWGASPPTTGRGY